MRESRTVGKLVRLKQKLGDSSPDYLTNKKDKVINRFRNSGLSDASSKELKRANNLYEVEGTSRVEVSRMLRRMETHQQHKFLSGDLDTSTRTNLYKAWEGNDDISARDVGDAAKTYRNLDSTAQTTYDELLDRKPAGATTLAAESDSDSLSTLLAAGCLQTRDVVINGQPVHKEEHPAPETLSNINEVGSVDHLFITGEHGRISLRVTDDGLENETTADEPTDPDHWDPE